MRRPLLLILLLFIGYLGLAVAGTFWGQVAVPPGRVIQVIAEALGLAEKTGSTLSEKSIILRLRLPQMVLLGLVGAALACSGAALQATFENPLADPGVLGVTSGGALGAVLAIHSGLAGRVFLSLPIGAFLGSLAAALAVYIIAYRSSRPTVPTLLLTGVAVGSMCAAGVSLVMMIVEPHQVQEMLFWLLGGVRHQTWEHVQLCGPAIMLGCAGLLLLHRRMDALLLGEEQALAVGVPVAGTRLAVLALTALAAGAATAVSGSIAFVGLMVPHFVRRFTGPRAIHLLPACAVGGAAFLTACELLSRAITQQFPLHLGILTAFMGGPAFLLILHRGERAAP